MPAFPVLFTPDLGMTDDFFFFYKEQEIMVLCQLFLSIKTLQIQQPLMELKGQRPYTGARLHRVAQITAEVTGLVLGLIAAGQLGQALRNKRIDWCNHGKGQSPRKRPTTRIMSRVAY